jgi:outer membrane protein OmpA-like peptidoglycan-associated protein
MQPGDAHDADKNKNNKHRDFKERSNDQRNFGEQRGEKRGFGKSEAGQNDRNDKKENSRTGGNDFKNQRPPAVTTAPPKPPVVNNRANAPQPNTLTKSRQQDDKTGDRNKPDHQKHFGDNDRDRGTANKPALVNPNTPPKASGFAKTPPKALSAGDARKRFDNMRNARKQKVEAGGKVIIEEPGTRTIFKQNNRIVIQHDENERLRKVAPNARFQKGAGGMNVSIVDRPGNIKIYTETDANGQLLRRYRRGPDGRETIIIDNRRKRRGGGKDVATGVGIGLGVVAGAAILNALVDVPEPRVRIPRDKYIVDYDGASEDDVYDALSAPPIDEYSDRYTLDEVRATARLRDRMRRVDLDDINFEFGSWDVDPSEYHKLARIARAMERVINRNPNEVFLIEGYTDAVGSEEDNLSLSDRRAESVAEVLTEQFDVPFENLTTQGYGEEFLKVQTDRAERLNRRVAVRRITPLLAREDGHYDRRGDVTRGSSNGASSGNSGRYDYSPYRSTPTPD